MCYTQRLSRRRTHLTCCLLFGWLFGLFFAQVSATVLGEPDVGLLTPPEMARKAGQITGAVPLLPVIADADPGAPWGVWEALGGQGASTASRTDPQPLAPVAESHCDAACT